MDSVFTDMSRESDELFRQNLEHVHSILTHDSRAIPFAVACLMAFLQILQIFATGFKHFSKRRKEGRNGNGTGVDITRPQYQSPRLTQRLRYHIHSFGGYTIFGFMVARLTGSAALVYLSSTSLHQCKLDADARWLDLSALAKCPERFTAISYFYASVSAFIALLSKAWSSWATRYNVIVVLSALGVYTYRDLWPLATYTEHPADEAKCEILYIEFALLTFTGMIIPLFVPRRYIPLDPKNPMPTPNPEQTASLFSIVTYTYLNPIVFLGYKVPHLRADLLSPLADYDAAKYQTEKAFPHLDVFRGAKRRHLFFGMMSVFRKEFCLMALTIVMYSMGTFASPIGINRILRYMETGGANAAIRPWFWIIWLFFGPMLQSLSFQWYIYLATRTLVRTEGLITQLVFEHSLRIRIKSQTSDDPGIKSVGSESSKQEAKANDNLIGKINNLVTTDLSNLVRGKDFLFVGFYVPLEVTLCTVFLYQVLGWSAFVGVATMLAFLPAPIYIAKKLQEVQTHKMKLTDARIQAVSETVSILRMIKLFGWEKKVSDRLRKTRAEELEWLWKEKLLNQINDILSYFFPTCMMLVTYVVYTTVMQEELNASKIFSSMAIFSILREQLYRLLWETSTMIQAKVSMDRIGDFLHNTELLDSFLKTSSTAAEADRSQIATVTPVSNSGGLGFRNATFSWSLEEDDGAITPSKRLFKLRINGELLFKRNQINLIIGPTGSGKTSVLMALLGEMHFISSSPDSWFNLPRNGGVAYAAQESWVQNDTIRNNILFGAYYDEERYRKVIKQCALERDLQLFDAGDATEVGERGLTLSGGQKARITLARAIYSPAEVILLDDVFAALDVHTSSWIIDQCFRGDLIRGRTILLVSHNIALASRVANFIVSIGIDGRVKTQGTEVSVAVAHDSALVEDLKHDTGDVIEVANDEIEDLLEKPDDGKLVLAEEMAQGHVTWKSFKLLVSSLGGYHPLVFFLIVIGSFLVNQWSITFQSWFLGYWGTQYQGHHPSEVDVSFYISVYSSILFGAFVFYSASYIFYIMGAMRASKVINNKLIDSVLGSTWRWLDETPSARIITRCTQDIRAVDDPIPHTFVGLIDILTGLLTKLGAVVLFTPLFLFPGLGVAVFGIYIGNMYLMAQLSVKRETSNARSPLLSHFSAAIQGLVSVRAYGAQKSFKEESLTRINHYTRVARMSYDLNRWISIRIDSLGAAFTVALASYLVYGTSVGASNAGFSLTMAVEFTQYILFSVRLYNNFEVNSNSLERIQGYLDIEHEPKPTAVGQPPAAWPTNGDLRVEHLSARYSQSGPKVLHDISFHIKSGQRIGVVGRTGSGKSTLTLALLRCILTEGTVYYDGVATNTINLDALRSSITIIPQTPELLSGTLRQNLDAFDQNDDATLNDALRSTGLFSLQDDVGEGRLSLDTKIASGGGNLSVGQRQIIALARAMVRRSKLLILDEATSAIDYNTDAMIQSTLRNRLGSDVTVITVAHRLQTIMDADRIMVLDNGRMVEFGRPKDLLKEEKGMLRALVDGSEDKAILYSLAAGLH